MSGRINHILPWWERWPGLLDREFNALRAANIPYERVEEAYRNGVMRLRLRFRLPADGREIELLATYPDLFPFFRFEIAAPGENLPLHQHPEAKNLCVLRRGSEHWDQDWTLAEIIQDQVPTVFRAALSKSVEEVAELEQHQAEPYSEYYPLDRQLANLLLIGGDWKIEPAERSGTVTIGLPAQQVIDGHSFLRGAVLAVRSNTGQLLARLDQRLETRYRGTTLDIRWVRLEEPLAVFQPRQFFEMVRGLDPGANNNRIHNFGGGVLQAWAVLFPEEVKWRDEAKGDGWIFVYHFSRQVDRAPPGAVVTRLPPKRDGKAKHRGRRR